MQREFSVMNSAELMDKVVDVYRKSFLNQVAFAAIVNAVSFIGVFIVAFIATVMFISVTASRTMGDFTVVSIAVIFLVALPLFILWNAFSSSGHILLSRQAFYGFRTSIKHMGVFKVFLRVSTAMIAQIIISIPFFIVIGLVAFTFTRVTADINEAFYSSVRVSIALILIIVLLMVVYLIFSHIFFLSVSVATFEKRYFFAAVTRAWQLIKPDFWRTLGVRAVWFLVAAVFSSTAQVIVTLIPFVGIFGTMSVTLLVAPLDGIMQSLIYFNQRMKHEGFDLEMRIDKLEAQ